MTLIDQGRGTDEIVKRALELDGAARENYLEEVCDDAEAREQINRRIRHERKQRIFVRAVELTPEAVQPYLDEACGDDTDLRAELERLIGYDHVTLGLDSPRPATPFGSLQGTVLADGKYRILAPISEDRSGMGDVYRAEQLRPIRKDVAVKVLQPGHMRNREVTERFKDEARALTLLDDHPNIARIHDTGEVPDGRPYFVMEYIPGGQDICRFSDDRRLTITERLQLFLQVCEAVEHAHSRQIIHRDIKPSNILVVPNGTQPRVKVIDFGIAKAFGAQRLSDRSNTIVPPLTPTYASPEQLRTSMASDSAPITLQSDVFSLGLVLYELLSGRRPCDDEEDQREMLVRQEKDLPPPSARVTSAGSVLAAIASCRSEQGASLAKRLRNELDWVTVKALEIDTRRRYPTVSHFREEIQHLLRGEKVEAGAQSVGYRARKFVARNRWRVALTSLALILLLVLVGFAVQFRNLQGMRELSRQSLREQYSRSNLALEGAIQLLDARLASGLYRGDLDPEMREAIGYSEDSDPWERRHFASRVSNDVGCIEIGEGIADVSLQPDGRQAAVAISSGFRLVDLGTMRTAALPTLPGTRPRSVSFHPSGKYVAGGGEQPRAPGGPSPGFVQVWDSEHRLSLGTWVLPEPFGVRWLAFMPVRDRYVLGVLGARGGVYLWEWASADRLGDSPPIKRVLREPIDGRIARMLAFDPLGRYLATGDYHSRDIELWDLAASIATGSNVPDEPCGVQAALLRGAHDHHLQSIRFSPDGALLASASMDRSIVLWDVEANVAAYDDYERLRQEYARRVTDLEAADRGDAPELPEPRIVGRLDDDTQGSIAITFLRSADRTLLFSAGADATVRQWRITQLSSDTNAWRISVDRQATWMGHVRPVYCIDSCTEGLIVTGSDDGTLRVWVPDLEVPATLRGHRSSVAGVAFSDDGQYAYTLDANRNLFVHDVHSGIEVARRSLEGGGWAFAYRRSASRLIAATQHYGPGELGGISVFDVGQGAAPWLATYFRPFGDQEREQVTAQTLSGDGRRLAIGDDKGRVQAWEIGGSRPIQLCNPLQAGSGIVRALAFLDMQGTMLVSTNGPVLSASGGEPPTILRWRVGTDSVEQLGMFAGGHLEPILDFAVSDDYRWFATASEDDHAALWSVDVESARWLEIKKILKGHIEDVWSLAFHPTEPRLASGSWDRTIKLWDIRSGIEVATLRGPGGVARDLAFSPDGSRLLSGSSGYEGTDNVAYLWDTFEDGERRIEVMRARAAARRAGRPAGR